MTHSPRQNTPDPESYTPSFRRRSLDTFGFMKKLRRFAGHLGRPVVRQFYTLYYPWGSEHTPRHAKMIIIGALVHFLNPTNSIPNLLIPFDFNDDVAVTALVYSQTKNYLTEDIKGKARQAADKLLGS